MLQAVLNWKNLRLRLHRDSKGKVRLDTTSDEFFKRVLTTPKFREVYYAFLMYIQAQIERASEDLNRGEVNFGDIRYYIDIIKVTRISGVVFYRVPTDRQLKEYKELLEKLDFLVKVDLANLGDKILKSGLRRAKKEIRGTKKDSE